MITDDVLDRIEAVIVDRDGTVVDRQQVDAITLSHPRRRYRAQSWQTQ